MSNDGLRRNSTTTLVVAIAVLAGINTIVLTSDLGAAMRYGLGTLSVIALLVCVFMLARNVVNSPDADAGKNLKKGETEHA